MTSAGEEHDVIMNVGCLTDEGKKKKEEKHNRKEKLEESIGSHHIGNY